MSKTCSKCKKTSLIQNFYSDVSKKDRLSSRCRACVKLRSKEQRVKLGPWFRREYDLKRLYGLTIEDYDNILRTQNGVCKICKEKCKTRKYLSVDHCHATGKVRGLLCKECNVGIGCFRNSALLMNSAAEYLENFNENPTNHSIE